MISNGRPWLRLPASTYTASSSYANRIIANSLQIKGSNATVKTGALSVKIDFEKCPRLEWFTKDGTPFHADSETRAYAFDAASGGVMHYVRTVHSVALCLIDLVRLKGRITSRPRRTS